MGWRTFVLTLRPSLTPGLKRHFLSASKAGLEKAGLVELSTRAFFTMPFSSTINSITTRTSSQERRIVSG